mmetsp:Transcript_17594/g.36661  ORF Transcript_17594/g.36661 Transcript_17594/m.36661 type:complete len:232 (-) Transcript_17594:33-728(-)
MPPAEGQERVVVRGRCPVRLQDRGRDAGHLQDLLHLLDGEVRQAQGPHLAGAQQDLQGPPRVLAHRGARVVEGSALAGLVPDGGAPAGRRRLEGVVQEKQVDVVCPEHLQRVGGALDGGVEALRPPTLCFQEDVFAARAHGRETLTDRDHVAVNLCHLNHLSAHLHPRIYRLPCTFGEASDISKRRIGLWLVTLTEVTRSTGTQGNKGHLHSTCKIHAGRMARPTANLATN